MQFSYPKLDIFSCFLAVSIIWDGYSKCIVELCHKYVQYEYNVHVQDDDEKKVSKERGSELAEVPKPACTENVPDLEQRA